MVILPLSYCFGASLLHTHLYAGGSVVLDRRFMFPDKVLRALADHNCTTFAGVPTAYNVLLGRSSIRTLALPSLRRFLQAGGRLDAAKINEMRAAFPRAKFYVMYGQTEATARIACMDPDRWEEKPGSVGRPLDNVTVRIISEAGDELPAGQVGQLCACGPSISAGYWNNQAETERVFRNGWLHTGDLARQDAEGYLWIEGRQGSFLKTRGVRVSFAEVEAMVAAMPGVYECAARAVAHAEAGEALEIFIVTNNGVTIVLEEVRRHLPAHWALDSVHFVAELPKTSAGKIALSSLPAKAKNLHAIAG
jgi:acyl-CoA synthetase (AMP-forming)/AMP-acid ligase II